MVEQRGYTDAVHSSLQQHNVAQKKKLSQVSDHPTHLPGPGGGGGGGRLFLVGHGFCSASLSALAYRISYCGRATGTTGNTCAVEKERA